MASYVYLHSSLFLLFAESVRGVTIPDPLEADGSETQAATVDFSVTEDSITPTRAAAAACDHENGEAETRFGMPTTSGDTLNHGHLQLGKDEAKRYSELNSIFSIQVSMLTFKLSHFLPPFPCSSQYWCSAVVPAALLHAIQTVDPCCSITCGNSTRAPPSHRWYPGCHGVCRGYWEQS